MYEHLVKNVRVRERGNWTVGIESITLEYEHAETGVKRVESVAATLVGAIETWLAQPTPPEPHERARVIVRWFSDGAIEPKSPHCQRALETRIADAIRDAIEADRAARGDT